MEAKELLIITPKTKVLQLIEAYPELEDVLIKTVPVFKKLKNPALKKTVAKVATLQQAAAIGSVKTEDLINQLRKEVGQDILSLEGDNSYHSEKPGWFDEVKISKSFDTREMLSVGEHPVNQVIADLQNLGKNEIYKMIAPFIPAPLIDKASSLGFDHWISQKADDFFEVYFTTSLK